MLGFAIDMCQWGARSLCSLKNPTQLTQAKVNIDQYYHAFGCFDGISSGEIM
jgi:hypothetical protein